MKSCARLSTVQHKRPAGLDKRITKPPQLVNLPHADGRSRLYILHILRTSIRAAQRLRCTLAALLAAVRLPRYLRAPRWRFLSLDCRSLRALRLGLLMANVPLP